MMTGSDVVRQALGYFFRLQEMNGGGKDMLLHPHFFCIVPFRAT